MHTLCIHLGTTLAVVWVCRLPVIAAQIEPPKPNPADPVDYIKWINNTMGGDIKDNACDAYQAAYRQLKPFKGDWGMALDGPWPDSQNQAVADWLEANRKGLGLFRVATSKPQCFFPLEEPDRAGDPRTGPLLLNVLLPHLATHRTAVKALVAEGYRAWQKGDRDLLPANALVVLRSAHHMDSCATLIERLVGFACAMMRYKAIGNSLTLSADPDSVAPKILPKFKAADPPSAPMEQTFLLERIVTWDSCQRLFVPGEKAGTWTLYEPACEGPAGVLGPREKADLIRIGFDKTVAEFNRLTRSCRFVAVAIRALPTGGFDTNTYRGCPFLSQFPQNSILSHAPLSINFHRILYYLPARSARPPGRYSGRIAQALQLSGPC